MDLKKLDTVQASREGRWLQLRHPGTREPLVDEHSGAPVRLRLLGPDAEPYQRAIEDTQRDLVRTALDRNESEREKRNTSVDLCVACLVGAEHVVVDGAVFNVTEDAARALFERFPWITEQCLAFIQRRANFLGN